MCGNCSAMPVFLLTSILKLVSVTLDILPQQMSVIPFIALPLEPVYLQHLLVEWNGNLSCSAPVLFMYKW